MGSNRRPEKRSPTTRRRVLRTRVDPSGPVESDPRGDSESRAVEVEVEVEAQERDGSVTAEPDWTKFAIDDLFDPPGVQMDKIRKFLTAFIDWRTNI